MPIIVAGVAASLTPNTRTGTLNITGQTFTVTQAGRPCTAAAISLGSAGQPVNGSLSANDCGSLVLASLAYASDRYTSTGAAGQLAPLSLNSAAFDPYLYLIGPGGAVLPRR